MNNMRRYQVFEHDTRVITLLCNWVHPLIITEDDYVCEACRDHALFCVNSNMQEQISGSSDPQAGPSHRRHNIACLLCGCSIAQRQSDVILRDETTEVQQTMIAIIESTIAPREISSLDRVCHPCWLHIQRRANRMLTENARSEELEVMVVQETSENLQPSQPAENDNSASISNPTMLVPLPDYRRAANTANHCVFPNCANTLHNITDKFRAIILSNHKYYIPKRCRICDYHASCNLWDTLFDSENSIDTFTPDQIQHVFSFVNTVNPCLDFENFDEMDDQVFYYWIGLTKEKFNCLIAEVPRIQQLKQGTIGLAALLLKMRTGDSNERISSIIKKPRRTLEKKMKKIKEILMEDFVPTNVGVNHLGRNNLLSHQLHIPNGLCGNGSNAITICDGTYVYMHKSSNYMFQKQSYSLHKYRNLLKPFLIVACDGYIVDVLGPYKATTSDAEIMNNLFHEESPLRLYFRRDDAFILDRGFRDSISFLEECGYKAYMPESLEEGEHQLKTDQANRSRCVTICRWVVEAVNGHFKRDFKIFRQEYFHTSLPNMMDMFKLAAALLNRFGVRFRDSTYANEILQIIRERMHLENNLSNMINDINMNRRTSLFESITANRENLLYFPTLEYKDLILFALGTYQIRQAGSYYGEHIRVHGGYQIEVCSEGINSAEYNLRGSGIMTLIRGKIKSRHITRKTYYVYILIENNIPGRTGITEYYCNCLVGRRTVGCCAHVMTIVWYLGWARHQNNITAPAEFLDHIIVRDDEELL